MHSSRADQWRGITVHAEDWVQGRSGRPALEAAVEAVAPVEGFHAYPGPALFAALRDRIAADDAAGALRLARRISNALLTRAYRERPGEWDAAEDTASEVIDVLPPMTGERRAPATLFRGPFRQQSAGRALAGAGRRAAPAAPPGGRVRLRAGLRRLVRGRVLRRRGQPGPRRRGHRRGVSLPLPLRRAGPALGARPAGRDRQSRRLGAAPGPGAEADPARARPLLAVGA